MSKPDAALLENVDERRLAEKIVHRMGNRVRNLRIIIRPDGIVLHGRTTTYYGKQLAQMTAREISNAPVLANHIEVVGAEKSAAAQIRVQEPIGTPSVDPNRIKDAVRKVVDQLDDAK